MNIYDATEIAYRNGYDRALERMQETLMVLIEERGCHSRWDEGYETALKFVVDEATKMRERGPR